MIIRKPLELPPAVDRAFVRDMKAFFAEENRCKQDDIHLRQLHALSQHQAPRDKKLGCESDVFRDGATRSSEIGQA